MTGHALYRYYDKGGELLYVGTTANLPTRTAQHGNKAWWTDVATSRVEHFDDRDAARKAEQAAIENEEPKYNVYRADGKTPLKSFRIPQDLYERAQARAAERGETLSQAVRKFLERYVK